MDKHIAVDMDDVLVDFVVGVCEAVSRDYGVDVDPKQVTSWQFGQFIDEHIGQDWWKWLEDHAWLWSEKFKPTPGAIGSIERLRREGYYLELVTSKPPWGEVAVWGWLAKYMRAPGLQRVTIVPLGASKTEITDARILVDDNADNARAWALSRRDRVAILYDRPHNQALDADEWGRAIVRAKSWAHVVELIHQEEP
jgi:5'(3')-deoxyribonucleotidase